MKCMIKHFPKKKCTRPSNEMFDHSRRCLAVKKNLEWIHLHSSKFNTVEIFQVSNHFRKDTCNSCKKKWPKAYMNVHQILYKECLSCDFLLTIIHETVVRDSFVHWFARHIQCCPRTIQWNYIIIFIMFARYPVDITHGINFLYTTAMTSQ